MLLTLTNRRTIDLEVELGLLVDLQADTATTILTLISGSSNRLKSTKPIESVTLGSHIFGAFPRQCTNLCHITITC